MIYLYSFFINLPIHWFDFVAKCYTMELKSALHSSNTSCDSCDNFSSLFYFKKGQQGGQGADGNPGLKGKIVSAYIIYIIQLTLFIGVFLTSISRTVLQMTTKSLQNNLCLI